MTFRRPWFRNRVASCSAALAVIACGIPGCSETIVEGPMPQVQFRVTSNIGPCSETLSIRFTIDGAVVGEEDFSINRSPSRTESSLFTVTPRSHVLGAQITRWGSATLQNDSTWADTTVNLTYGQRLVRSIDLYCS
jgi:hypothetical protein